MELMQNAQQDFKNFTQLLTRNPEMCENYVRVSFNVFVIVLFNSVLSTPGPQWKSANINLFIY